MNISLSILLISLALISLTNSVQCEKPDFVILDPSVPSAGQPSLEQPSLGQPTLEEPTLEEPNPEEPNPEAQVSEPYDIIVHLHRSRRFLLTGAKNEGKLIVKLFSQNPNNWNPESRNPESRNPESRRTESRNSESRNPEEQVFQLDLTTTRLKTLTKQVLLNPEILIDEEEEEEEVSSGHSRSRSGQESSSRIGHSRSTEQERKRQAMASVTYLGDGEGSLEIRRISFIPSGGRSRLNNLKKSKCAKFDDNNLLESRLGIQKVLTHKDCQSRLISRG